MRTSTFFGRQRTLMRTCRCQASLCQPWHPNSSFDLRARSALPLTMRRPFVGDFIELLTLHSLVCFAVHLVALSPGIFQYSDDGEDELYRQPWGPEADYPAQKWWKWTEYQIRKFSKFVAV
ncbi:unnamed protein product [Sphagnum balticum]